MFTFSNKCPIYLLPSGGQGALEPNELITHIQNELQKRRLTRRHLALKAGIPSGRLSEILNAKRPLSPYYASKILGALKLDSSLYHKVKKSHRTNHRPDRNLSDDEIQLIQEWYHPAIINLVSLPDAQTDPQWFADRLSISLEQSEKALKRLLRLNLIALESGRYVRTSVFISTRKDVTSSVVREVHEQMLERSKLALNRIPVEFRDISHMVLTINPQKMTQAKKEIQTFRKRLANMLQEGAQEDVYLLGVQLVPLSRLKASK